MAATSFTTHGLGHHGKITKARARTSVKPILKKLHSTHSEKNSLDLDRGWDDQESPYLGYMAPDNSYSLHSSSKHHSFSDDNSASTGGLFDTSYPPTAAGAGAGAAAAAAANSGTATTTGGRTIRDVSFTLSATDLAKTSSLATTATAATILSTTTTTASTITSASATSISTGNHQFSHVRSTSGISNISTATSLSGRNGSFVHPFQQTPRASTPPLLSYATSINSLDNNTNSTAAATAASQRDYSPVITEDCDDSLEPFALPPPSSKPLHPTLPHSHSNWAHRRTSYASNQRNSLSDANAPLRVSTTRSSSGTVPRGLALSVSTSVNQCRLSEGQLGGTQSVTVIDDSPVAENSLTNSPKLVASYGPTSASPMSPLRHSLDMNPLRIRSRSDVDTATRQEQVRQARRKFEEKEKAKEEKYAREQSRKRERADTKEAHRQDRAHHSRKGSFGAIGRKSSSDVRPDASRKSTGQSRSTVEKGDSSFGSQGYKDMTTGQSPGRADEVHFESNRRSRQSAKRKTTGTWTAFVLWFRTRLLKLGRR